ncbi:hypothetical protein B0T10DRAFT_415440 [Thelonectria olida]|uniref:Zn(2)-C6 fungal-type domain-containing protein n=1 Tax=Thelonectria olida TaxID=1576542 RepID=A0A9P8VTD2_9HYPO|nr:hypothetical protein B0T10DRAFT_415440 [Thelonectria olida]
MDGTPSSSGSNATDAPPTNSSLHKASRKSHSKTRTGCNTCKKRKIKCDETRPSCRNCIKHSVTCDFIARTIPVSIPASNPEPSINLQDLELLHNFTSSTYSTLTTDPDIRNLWKTAIIRKAIECTYVMHSVLAVSAVHLAHYRPEKRQSYMSQGLHHHQIATREATQLMSELRTEHCEHLWIFSILTIYFTLGCPRTDETSLLFGKTVFPDWIFLLTGVRHLLLKLQSESYSGVLSPVINRGSDRWLAVHEPQHENARMLNELSRRVAAAVSDETELKIYQFALHELRCQLSFVLSAGHKDLDIIDGFVWQFSVADDFLPLLNQSKPEAVAIFAHSCIILKALEKHWWVQGWGDFLLSKAWDVLDDEYRLWVQWPIEEMGWVVP